MTKTNLCTADKANHLNIVSKPAGRLLRYHNAVFSMSLLFLVVFLIGCRAQTIEIPQPTALLRTTTPLPSATVTSLSTLTPTLTSTRTPIPRIFFTPPAPLSIDVAQFVEIRRIGNGTINMLRVSPDGKSIALAGSLGVWLYNAQNMELLAHLYKNAGFVNDIAWSPKGQYLAVANSNGTVQIWDAKKQKMVQSFDKHHSAVVTVTWSPDGKRLASGGTDNIVRVWTLETATEIQTLPGLSGGECGPCYVVGSLSWSPDGKDLAVVSANTLLIWELATNTTKKVFHEQYIHPVKWSPDGQFLAAGISGVLVMSTKDWMEVSRGGGSTIYDISWSSDGSYFVASAADGTAYVWVAKTDEYQDFRLDPQPYISAADWLPNSNQFISIYADRVLRKWDITSSHIPRETTPLSDFPEARDIAWSPDGKLLATANGQLLNPYTGKVYKTLHIPSENVYDLPDKVYWSPDGTKIAFLKTRNRIVVWDWVLDKEVMRCCQHAHLQPALAWSPDGNTVAFAFQLNSSVEVDIWNMRDAKIVQRIPFTGYAWELYGIAWSPDGNLMATVDGSAKTRIFDREGVIQKQFSRDDDAATGIAWSSDGRLLITAGWDADIQIWNTETWEEIPVSITAKSFVRSISLSPDNRYLATGGDGGPIVIGDIQNNKQIKTLTGNTTSVLRVAWSPKGDLLASVSEDGTIRIWGLPLK
jgi:WD40 repeat protein